MRINICGVKVDKYNFDEAVEAIVDHAAAHGTPKYVVTPNAHHITLLKMALINTKVRAAAPDILFVGLGAPKQEYWMYGNCQELGVPISLGIGVSFEFVSGMVPKVPIWMQKLGLEWFFRLITEPRRLWRRSVVANSSSLWLLFKQRLGLLYFE